MAGMSTVTDRTGNRHDTTDGRFAGHVPTPQDGRLDDPAAAPPDAPAEPATVWHIPTVNLPAFRERVAAANHRLAQAGVAERFTYTATPRMVADPRSRRQYLTNDVTLNRPAIRAGSWRFDGVCERAANGRTLTHWAGGVEAAVDDADLLVCDQCGHRRSRTRVFILTDPSTGDRKQVGTNCLQLFLGVRPVGLWALTDEFEAADLNVDDDDLSGFTVASIAETEACDILTATLDQIGHDGVFLSRAKATMFQTPTADLVLERLRRHAAWRAEPTPAQQEEIDRILEWVDGIDPQATSEYEANLHEALAPDRDGVRRVSRKHVPLVCSAVSAYRNHVERQARAAARDEQRRRVDAGKTHAYLAEPGAKLRGRDVHATVLSVRLGVDYGYGAPFHITMLDGDGHVIYWKASSCPSEIDDGAHVVIMSGTVKANRVSDYNGDWETVITRAKLVPDPDGAADGQAA